MLKTEYFPMPRLTTLPEVLPAPVVMEFRMTAGAERDHIPHVLVAQVHVIKVVCFESGAYVCMTNNAAPIVESKPSCSDFLPVRMTLDVFLIIYRCSIRQIS